MTDYNQSLMNWHINTVSRTGSSSCLAVLTFISWIYWARGNNKCLVQRNRTWALEITNWFFSLLITHLDAGVWGLGWGGRSMFELLLNTDQMRKQDFE